jgi:hypothetical protein
MPVAAPQAQAEAAFPDSDDRKWSAWMALLTAGLLPATTARRTASVRLRTAFAVHFSAALIALLLIACLVAWEAAGPAWDLSLVVGHTARLIGEAFEEFRDDPFVAVPYTIITAIVIELSFTGLALVMMPWSAGDEPLGDSFRHGLRRAWLLTPHALPLIFLFGAAAVPVWHTQRSWHDASEAQRMPVPAQPPNAQPGTPEWEAWQAAMREYNAAWQAAWQRDLQRRAWLARYGEALVVCMYLVLATWFLWTLFRSAAARRPVRAVAHPPTCEWCGYNLTHAPMEGRCPECGRHVADSLAADVRGGTPWQRRRHDGRWRAWWRCGVDAMCRPRQFGRQLQGCTPAGGHSVFLAVHLAPIFLFAIAGLVATVVAGIGWENIHQDLGQLCLVGLVAAHSTVAVMFAAASLAAAGTAIGYWIVDRRNLLSASVQAACYLSFWLVAWVVFAGSLGVAVVLLGDVFGLLARPGVVMREFLQLGAWLVGNLVCLAVYVRLVVTVTAGARYANK